MEKNVSKEEQELVDKILPLINEAQELAFKRGNGVTLEKNDYIGDRTAEIETELGRLKSEKLKLRSETKRRTERRKGR